MSGQPWLSHKSSECFLGVLLYFFVNVSKMVLVEFIIENIRFFLTFKMC